jgi:hypothetical protein
MNCPELWSQLLSEAPKGSVIMGGAIVDWVAGIQPKDIDIFHTYQVGTPDVPAHWQYIEMDWNDPVKKAAHEQEYQLDAEGKHNSIGSVYEYKVNGYTVQMIGVHYDDPREQFKKFDHSLTLGSFSDNGLFIHTDVFSSLQDKTVHYYGKVGDNRAARSFSRALKKINRIDHGNMNAWAFKGFYGPE